jgi:hypothetical protein
MEQTSANCLLSKEAQLTINWLPPSTLIPYVNNPRKHPRAQIDLIAKSIKQFGWTNPILIGQDNEVLCGHGRLRAALQMGASLDPKYAEVALRRVADETGQTPMLDGLPLHEVATVRKEEGHRDAA